MTDSELLAAFDTCTLSEGEWTHRAHVRVAWMFASSGNFTSALDGMRSGIQSLNSAIGTPESLDRGYHETITAAFMRLVYAADQRTGPHESSDDFCNTHPQLLSKSALLHFYSRERLMTMEAKSAFVEPDVCPLPEVSLPSEHQFEDVAVPDGFTLVDSLSDSQIRDLHELTQQQWWGGRRSLEDVQLMVEHTSLMLGLVDDRSGRLVGFCRALTDFSFRATIYDVMIDVDVQGRGFGKTLLDTLFGHPRLTQVNFLYLCCEPELYSFYEQWGFQAYSGRAEWMIKVQHAET